MGGENSSLKKVPERTFTSCFTMILMTPVHFASLSFVGLTTSILRYEGRGTEFFRKCLRQVIYLLFHDDNNVLYALFKFQHGTTEKQFSIL